MSLEVAKKILDNSQKDVEMRTEHQVILYIPSKTLEAIKSLDPEVKVRVIAKMSNAVNDAKQIDLKPKK